MYKIPKMHKSELRVNKAKEGEPLFMKLERMTQQKDRLGPGDIKPLTYTDRKDGVIPQTDIRSDKWELGAETTTKVANEYVNRGAVKPKDTKGESTDGKSPGGDTGEPEK